MSAKWKRNTVVATMAVLVCAAVALNWRYSGEAVQSTQETQDTDTKILGEAALVSGQEDDTASGAADESEVYTGSDYFASAQLTR